MSATPNSPMANLSHLPHDVLVLIAKRLKKLEDFISFRCVSKSLCAAAKDEYFEGVRVRQQIPYLLLPVRDDGDDDVRELYSLVDCESVVASIKFPKFKTKKCLESLGWLLAVGEDGSMSLLDPFLGSEIPLPHQRDVPPQYETRLSTDEHLFIHKMALSSSPSETLDFVLMVICGHMGHLAFWRLGDKTWNVIEERPGRFADVIHNGGEQFYAIGYPGNLWAINLAGNNNHENAHMIMRCGPIVPRFVPPHPDYPSKNLYIVKSIDDTLLIITRKSPTLSEDGSSYLTNEFRAYEVDIGMGSYKEIHSLGSMAVFIGHNNTIALDASKLPGGVIKANHIYFTDDDFEYYFFTSPKGGGRNMGVYNFETGTVEAFYPGEPLCSKVSTSVWITSCFGWQRVVTANIYVTAASEEDINGPDIMSEAPMANLSHLPHDVLVVIAKQLKKLEDFVSFRCVSKSLLAAAKDEYFEGVRVRRHIPYLLLPVRDDGDDDVRELYSLVEGESIVACVQAPKLKTKKCFESLGWLLAVEEDGSMSLLDPFSGSEILLPHQCDIPQYNPRLIIWKHYFIQKMVLSSRPSETLDFVLMVICGNRGHLAFWRLGDETWNVIDERVGRFIDVIHNGGDQFYAISISGVVWDINLVGNSNHAEAHIIMRCEPVVPGWVPPHPDYLSSNLYIVKTFDDTLLIISRKSPILNEDGSSYITNEIHVYEVDIGMSSYKEIHSLGSMAVFVGYNSTIALDSSKLSRGVIKANHIYFTDDDWEHHFQSPKGGGQNMGVYNLETRTIEPFYPGEPLCSKVSTSVWITPCL